MGSYFSDGMATITTNATGYINKDGTIIIEPKFHSSGNFHEGLACASLEENDLYG